ncbi:MAG: bifunctional UDP-N-acetylglucosamine diphosphorylase/glucosamine-1-phosphate N-acetyltransferase GlmU [Tatlockia sp.]
MALHIVILAAGQGKRMYSSKPKVLHQLAGKSMLERVVDTASALQPEAIHVIIGHESEQIKAALPHLAVNWIFQAEQLGTGHAVMQALDYIPLSAKVLVLSADVPLIQTQTLSALLDCSEATGDTPSLALLLARLENPTGLGRIVRNESGQILAIVEEKDASEAQKQIKEIYSGICCTSAVNLSDWLPKLSSQNAQGEYYLTEIIAMAVADGVPITSMLATDNIDIQGVNNRLQLQQLERLWQTRGARKLMLAGVSLADENRIDIRGELDCGQDVFIDVNAVISGKVTIGDGSHIGPNCVLKDATIGRNTQVFANSVIDTVTIGDHCEIGPFARLRPGTQLAAFCKIGNFVETKNSVFSEGTKANHLSYVGDAIVGKKVNLGAGTITCNYDGANKYQTIIEDGVFIGSASQLVAPVLIGANATIGAGSTIRKNVPAGELTLTESKQKTVFGWKRPVKK